LYAGVVAKQPGCGATVSPMGAQLPQQGLTQQGVASVGEYNKASQHHCVEHALALRCHDKLPSKPGNIPSSKVSPQTPFAQVALKQKRGGGLGRPTTASAVEFDNY